MFIAAENAYYCQNLEDRINRLCGSRNILALCKMQERGQNFKSTTKTQAWIVDAKQQSYTHTGNNRVGSSFGLALAEHLLCLLFPACLQERIFLKLSNYIFTAIFVTEMTIKVGDRGGICPGGCDEVIVTAS